MQSRTRRVIDDGRRIQKLEPTSGQRVLSEEEIMNKQKVEKLLGDWMAELYSKCDYAAQLRNESSLFNDLQAITKPPVRIVYKMIEGRKVRVLEPMYSRDQKSRPMSYEEIRKKEPRWKLAEKLNEWTYELQREIRNCEQLRKKEALNYQPLFEEIMKKRADVERSAQRFSTFDDATDYDAPFHEEKKKWANKALAHYNQEKGVDFELVNVLGGCKFTICGVWFHVNFEAKPRNTSCAPKLFFAELYPAEDFPTTLHCDILDPDSSGDSDAGIVIKGCNGCTPDVLHPAWILGWLRCKSLMLVRNTVKQYKSENIISRGIEKDVNSAFL